ncbi:MAG: nicotinate-nucleotide adenylyltransferase [Thermodesulfobacteriota bacterium]
MGAKLKVGLFGGSFNPLHIGHLRAAEEVREILDLDKIIFIPSSIHPIKNEKNIVDAKYRLRMLELATRDIKDFEVSVVEMKRPGPSYTVDTSKYFKDKFKNYRLFFILGTENLAKIDTWKDYKELFKCADFAVLSRPGYNLENIRDIIPRGLVKQFKLSENKNGKTVYKHSSGNSLVFFKIKGIRISSTTLRKLVENGKSIKYFVPDSVNKYILKNKLYLGE